MDRKTGSSYATKYLALIKEMGLFLQEHHSSNIFLMQILLITKERKALCIPPWLQLLSELDNTCLGCTGVEGIKKTHSPSP